MTAQEAYRMFLVALATAGYDVVPGDYMKVVESQQIKRENLPLHIGGRVSATETIMRYAYRPTYAQPDTLVAAFTALKSDAGDVQLIGGMLLVTDRGTHLDKMLSLAKLIDVPKGSDGIYLLPVKYADAAKLQDKLNQLLGLSKEAPSQQTPNKPGDPAKVAPPVAIAVPSRIIVEERTNTLIVTGNANAYERVRALVESIDVPLEIEGGAQIHVYRLGSSIAEELAKTLESLISGQRSNTPARPNAGGPNAQQPPPPPVPTPAAPGTAGMGTALEGQVRVIADKPTNSLIVMSNGRDYLAMREVIRQLDMPKRQVYIETVILEVAAGSSLDVGTSSHGGLPGLGGMMLGGVQLPSLSSLALGEASGIPTGLVGALLGKELPNSQSLFGKSIPSYGVLFQAIAGDDRAKLVSAPSIIGVDNEETVHRSGSNISYDRGTSTFTGNGVQQTNNLDRKPLELKLWIKPHVFVDDHVMIELKLDSEDLGGTDGNKQPIWTNRNIETRVVVRDQQTVVIGSLTQERETHVASKVPLLGDVPILGHLFKYTKKTKRKTNLLVMMTPYVVKDHMDLQAILDRKLRDSREFAGSFASLDGAKYTPRIDYTRKRGLVEEINRTLGSIEDDVNARNSLKRLPSVKQGPIEYKAD
jgi:general secretion pathway protein D